MVEVEMSRDIHEYEPKLVGPLTLRQLILVVIGLAYTVPAVIFIKIDNLTLRLLFGALLMIPVLACGWVPVMGMRIEQFLYAAIKDYFPKSKRVRVYEAEMSTPYLDEAAQLPPQEGKKKTKVRRTSKYQGRK